MATEQKKQWSFAGIADGYDRYLAPLLAMWTADLFDKTEIGPGDAIVDVACGTGIVARRAADQIHPGGTITGVDVDAGMLEVARAKGRDLPVSVTWHEANATALPLDDESFDAVFCQQGLQFISDRSAAIQQMRRVLKSGGHVAISVWGPLEHTPGYAALGEAMEIHLGEEPAAINAVPFSLDDEDELASLLERADFVDIDVESVTREVHFASPREFFRREVVSWLAGAFAEPEEKQRRAVVSELEQRLESYIDPDGLTFPMEALIAGGRKP